MNDDVYEEARRNFNQIRSDIEERVNKDRMILNLARLTVETYRDRSDSFDFESVTGQMLTSAMSALGLLGSALAASVDEWESFASSIDSAKATAYVDHGRDQLEELLRRVAEDDGI